MPVHRNKGAKGKADVLFSQIIRSQGYCEAYGKDDVDCSAQLQTAHIITRKRSATRTDLRNAFCLCFAHHRFYTDYPRQFSHFISDGWAKDYYDTIHQASRIPTKVDWEDRAVFLSDVHQKLSSGVLTIAQARKLED